MVHGCSVSVARMRVLPETLRFSCPQPGLLSIRLSCVPHRLARRHHIAESAAPLVCRRLQPSARWLAGLRASSEAPGVRRVRVLGLLPRGEDVVQATFPSIGATLAPLRTSSLRRLGARRQLVWRLALETALAMGCTASFREAASLRTGMAAGAGVAVAEVALAATLVGSWITLEVIVGRALPLALVVPLRSSWIATSIAPARLFASEVTSVKIVAVPVEATPVVPGVRSAARRHTLRRPGAVPARRLQRRAAGVISREACMLPARIPVDTHGRASWVAPVGRTTAAVRCKVGWRRTLPLRLLRRHLPTHCGCRAGLSKTLLPSGVHLLPSRVHLRHARILVGRAPAELSRCRRASAWGALELTARSGTSALPRSCAGSVRVARRSSALPRWPEVLGERRRPGAASSLGAAWAARGTLSAVYERDIAEVCVPGPPDRERHAWVELFYTELK